VFIVGFSILKYRMKLKSVVVVIINGIRLNYQ